MTAIKSYTDIKQSRKLAKILPLESADMHYVMVDTENEIYSAGLSNYIGVLPSLPCWSLAALLAVFNYYEINNFGDNIQFDAKGIALSTEENETLLDVVVNMIILLHKQNLL